MFREAAALFADLTHLPLEAAELGTSLLGSGHYSMPIPFRRDRYWIHSWQRQAHLTCRKVQPESFTARSVATG